MPTFRIHLKTVLAVAATGADLSSTVSVVHAAGGTDVSVFQNDEHGRAEFSLQANDRNQGFLSAARLLAALTEATPLLVGGWVLVSIT
jgi:hypothetical protein